jgi:hypothetical protein
MGILSMFLSWQITTLLLLIGISIYSYRSNRDKHGRKYNFPPGPKGLPLMGNSFDLPPFGASALTKKWAEKYGEMYSIKVLGVNEKVSVTYWSYRCCVSQFISCCVGDS